DDDSHLRRALERRNVQRPVRRGGDGRAPVQPSLGENPLDSTQKAKAANAIASKFFDGAEGDSLLGFEGKDLRAKARLSVQIKHAKAASSAGETEIFTTPLGSMSGITSAAKELEKAKERRF